MKRALLVLLAMVGILAAPFLLRPTEEVVSKAGTQRLVIISPHNETIRSEFEKAFTRHMRETTGREVLIDWRQPGGTAEIALFLKSEYERVFREHWIKQTNRPFSPEARSGFAASRPGNGEAKEARRLFLDSSVGVGVDLFFGGGAFDFQRQADAGALVSTDASGRFGPGAYAKEHPEVFTDAVFPQMVGGEPYRDPEFRWLGCCLSSFGICYNTDVLERLQAKPPTQWSDLADPGYLGQIALADPAKSGSATKAFEMILQQQMQLVLNEGMKEPEAVAEGWMRGWRLIQRISGNGRYFTDSATKIPHDVAAGDSAAGMCIDFYGRTYNELHRQPDGSSRIQFVTPIGGTSTGVDPIGLLRGAPSPELAHQFLAFVLSPAGQRLWNYRPGTPGGPDRVALRRLPVRRDSYAAADLAHFTDPEVLPYDHADAFTYHESWTGPVFGALRFIMRCGCVESHIEQRSAWRALIAAGFPAEAKEAFDDLSFIDLAHATDEIGAALKAKNKVKEVELARELSAKFRAHYARVLALTETKSP